MTIIYKLNINLVARAAAELNWKLKQLDTSIYIVADRLINAKSLVGILSGNFQKDQLIKISFEDIEYVDKIKEIFNEIGEIIE